MTVENDLDRINRDLVNKDRFFDALNELMILAKDHFDNAQLWLLVGAVYTRMAYWQDAIGALETALSLDSGLITAKRLLSLSLFSIGRKDEACKLIDEAVELSEESGDWMLRAYLHAHTSSDPSIALSKAKDWAERFADPLTEKAEPINVKNRNPHKRLKVGYVTADFKQHAVAFFMEPILAHHNSDILDIYVFSNGPTDAVTIKLRKLVPFWYDVNNFSNSELWALIREKEIDVLVDLSGFTHGHRLEVFARRAAPVQVTWLGYLQTLGMKAMDYRIVSRSSVQPEQKKFYSEKIFYVNGMACYSPPENSPLCNQPPILKNGYTTYISLNNSAKITDEVLEVWCHILKKNKKSKLIILVKERSLEAAKDHMLPRIQKAGFPLDSVFVLPQQSLDKFMELGYIADVALDTFPISGGTTTLHSLWMGLPIVTLDGLKSVESSSARTLRGLSASCGVVANNIDEYIAGALDIACDKEKLIFIRNNCRDILMKSGFMNYKKRTHQIEKAFFMMWMNYLLGEKRLSDINDDWKMVFDEINLRGLHV